MLKVVLVPALINAFADECIVAPSAGLYQTKGKERSAKNIICHAVAVRAYPF